MLRGSNILFIRINQLPKEQYNAPNHISYQSNKKKPTENNISFLSYLFSSLPAGTNPPPRNFPCHHLPSSVTKYLITISLIILIIVLIVSLFSKTMLINQLNLIVIIFLVRGILIFFF